MLSLSFNNEEKITKCCIKSLCSKSFVSGEIWDELSWVELELELRFSPEGLAGWLVGCACLALFMLRTPAGRKLLFFCFGISATVRDKEFGLLTASLDPATAIVSVTKGHYYVNNRRVWCRPHHKGTAYSLYFKSSTKPSNQHTELTHTTAWLSCTDVW